MKNIVFWSQGKVSTVEEIKAFGISEEEWNEYMDFLQQVLHLFLPPLPSN